MGSAIMPMRPSAGESQPAEKREMMRAALGLRNGASGLTWLEADGQVGGSSNGVQNFKAPADRKSVLGPDPVAPAKRAAEEQVSGIAKRSHVTTRSATSDAEVFNGYEDPDGGVDHGEQGGERLNGIQEGHHIPNILIGITGEDGALNSASVPSADSSGDRIRTPSHGDDRNVGLRERSGGSDSDVKDFDRVQSPERDGRRMRDDDEGRCEMDSTPVRQDSRPGAAHDGSSPPAPAVPLSPLEARLSPWDGSHSYGSAPWDSVSPSPTRARAAGVSSRDPSPAHSARPPHQPQFPPSRFANVDDKARELHGDHEETWDLNKPPREEMERAANDVEIIDVPDSDDDDEPVEISARAKMNGVESDDSSTQGGERRTRVPSRRYGLFTRASRSRNTSVSPEEGSDDDDCVVLDERPDCFTVQVDDDEEEAIQLDDDEEGEEESDEKSDDSDSDMEVVGPGSQSNIQRNWEEAAMSRRMGRAMRSEGSKANGEHDGPGNLDDGRAESQGMEESVATSTYRSDSQDQTELSEARGGAERVGSAPEARPSEMVDDSFARNVSEDVEIRQFGSNSDWFRSAGRSGKAKVAGSNVEQHRREDFSNPMINGEGSGNVEILPSEENSDRVQIGSQQAQHEEDFGIEIGDQQQGQGSDRISLGDLIAGKEMLKQTDEYRQNDAAEWKSRKEEIQRQLEETRKLVLRKKYEANRQKETERKQKDRVEELRLSQQKEQRNTVLKEQARGQVRTQLEHIASSCSDFPSVLRRLGIPVDGGSQPSAQQVKDAYNTALKKFHPDRAATQGNPRYQVEAEEKCKLILRLKKTFNSGN